MAKDYTKATWIDEVLGGGGIPLYDIDGGSIGNDVTIEQVETVSVAGTELNAAKMNNIETGIDALDTFLKETISEITVSAGVLTVTKTRHKIQPESGTADNVDTISGIPTDTFGILVASDPGTDTLTFKHGTGNISCFGGDDLELSEGVVFYYYNGTTVFLAGGGGSAGSKGTYSPALTNLTIGSGTVEAYYQQSGDVVIGYVTITLAADSSVSGQIGIGLPVTAAFEQGAPLGYANYHEYGGAYYYGQGQWGGGGNRADMKAGNSSASYLSLSNTNTNVPFTWGTDDRILFNFHYIAA